MSHVGFRAQNHPQQQARDDVDDRATTGDVFGPLDREFGPFTVDVAAAAHNTKCARFYDRATDGLAQSWAGERVWCNPPYSQLKHGTWTTKAWAETAAEVVVMLLPANRCEQTWWQTYVEPHRDRPGSPLSSRFLPGRLRFLLPGRTSIGADERPPFGCVLLIWRHAGPYAGPHVATLLDGAA